MNGKPLVSVIIPTYNRGDKLSVAIDSVYSQHYKNIELIVVDDGSSDNTADVLNEYPGAIYIKQLHAGQAAARNNGLQNSRGSIIASLDSDDYWEPDFLTRCIEKLEHDKLDFVFANWSQQAKFGNDWDFLNRDPFLMPYFEKVADSWVVLEYTELRKVYMEACPSPSSSVVIRKSSIVSGWDNRINIADDWCMYLEVILSKECRAAFTLDKLWKKRIDDINIYDGRKRNEVLRHLYISDTLTMMDKFSKLLTRSEMYILKQRYMSSLVELAKHELIREYNIKECLRLLKDSFTVNVPFTLKMIPDVFMKGLKGKYDALSSRA
jgi:glycosyltransferase involved in cell wall biosynthesis